MHSVEISELPGAPEIVQGVVNIGGEIIPGLNFRKRFQLKEKTTDLKDNLLIVNTNKNTLCFFVDKIIGLKTIKQSDVLTLSGKFSGFNNVVEGITNINDEIILIHDFDKF